MWGVRLHRCYLTNNSVIYRVLTGKILNRIKDKTVYKFNKATLAYFPPSFQPVFEKANQFRDRVAITDQFNQYNYEDILYLSGDFANRLKEHLKHRKLNNQPKIAFLCPSDVTCVVTQWSCWMEAFIAVPLCEKHPPQQLEYYIKDSQCDLIVTTAQFSPLLKSIADNLKIPVVEVTHPGDAKNIDKTTQLSYQNKLRREMPAMFVYTSGTTGRPKGVVLTHENLHVQASAVNQSWEIKSNDVIMHALPLHHLHGILNGLCSPLLAGASVVMLPKFDPKEIWEWFLGKKDVQPTVFHGVPTMYSLLIREIKENYLKGRSKFKMHDFIEAFCTANIRFMACGSASLPIPILQEWKRITGHVLLERYGMTELGMVFTNPLAGERKPGSVGNPFPGTNVRIGTPNAYSQTEYEIICEGDFKGSRVTKGREDDIGELLVKGSNVFQGYWNRNDDTRKAFTKDKWFKTGDTAQFVNGSYRILGRTSVDIIKSGGFKISALDIECQLLSNPKIKECAVFGLPDLTWGEKVAAAIVTIDDLAKPLSLAEIRQWCSDKLPSYSIPSVIVALSSLPKNILGKVNKAELKKDLFLDKKSQT